jgi:hypothetical protein
MMTDSRTDSSSRSSHNRHLFKEIQGSKPVTNYKTPQKSGLEGNIVVWPSAAIAKTAATAAEIAAATAGCIRRTATGSHIGIATTQEADLITDNLGAPTVFSFPILPFSGLQTSLDVYLSPFLHKAAYVLSCAAKADHRVPFGLIVPVAILILSAAAGSDAQVTNGVSRLTRSDLRILSEITN